jgi:hypothetical protein
MREERKRTSPITTCLVVLFKMIEKEERWGMRMAKPRAERRPG